jgi:very-short-patch-repair endonuclease
MAPEWAASIRNRLGNHGKAKPPGDPAAAWEWRQLHDELELRSKVDLEELGARIAAIKEELRRTTNELIDKLAWAGQIRRTSLKERKALIGWLDTIRRIGKGTGKRVPLLRREAQLLMAECRTAVPVWIMPMARLMESFDFGKQCFDVVIIDEASQCDVMALLALTLEKKVVIVGDNEQVSPLAVGQNQDFVDKLIRVFLQGIPLAHLYDGRTSIYDLAGQSFAGLISLWEHFRCVPDIIQFSNHLCYQGNIKPLREEGSCSLRPHVVRFRVEGSCDSEKVNREEAWTVASLLAAAIERPEYQNMTFGVISLLGIDQAYEIEQLLLKHSPPEEYQRRRIVCGNSAQFQGDERDVMFLSMVWSPEEKPLTFNDRKEFRQRFNVAASRARNQMWLVYSLDPMNDLKAGDLRRRLIEHVLDPRAITREIERSLERTQSRFESLVLGHLVRAGYGVVSQWPVGRYRIDLVVEGGGKRLAVECDGDRYHPLEKLPEDMERQAILERLGWRFFRIRGTAFFRNQESTMQTVLKKLEELGIPPEGVEQPETQVEDSLISAIRRRASEIRADWQEKINSRSESQAARSPDQQAGQAEGERPPRDIDDKANAKCTGSQNLQSAKQVCLFPVDGGNAFRQKPDAFQDSRSGIAVPSEPTSYEVESRGPRDSEGKGGVEATWTDGLMSLLDKTIFPAVAGTEPQGSRRARLERWRSALRSCAREPAALYAALAACDAAISNGRDGPKVRAAIQMWHAGSQK